MSEIYFQNILDNIYVFLAIVDTEGDILFINQYGASQVEQTPDKLISQNIANLLTTDEARHQLDRIKKVIKTGQPHSEESTIKVNNRVKWFYSDLQPYLSSDGKIAGAIVSARDITGRKKAEAALTVSEERFRGIFENATIGIYRTTPDGQILMANPALVRMLGFENLHDLTRSNLEKDNYQPLYSRAEFKKRIESEKKISGMETVWMKEDGTLLYVRESAHVAYDENGEVKYYEGTVEDISGEHKAQQELKKALQRLKEEHKKLEEKNAALKEVLTHIEEEKVELRGQIAREIDQSIIPALNKVANSDGRVDTIYLDLAKKRLTELAQNSGGTQYMYTRLTLREAEICNLIKSGATSKDIANRLHISLETVNKHRASIRRKLGITNKSVNLASFLTKI